MHRGRGGTRQGLPEHCYRVHRSPETVTVSIPCNVMERLFAERSSLIINLQAVPDSLPVHLPRLVSRFSSSWSTVEPVEEGPPSYQDVVEGRVDSWQVDQEIPPTNIFTEETTPEGGLCYLVQMFHHISPRGRGLARMVNNNIRSPFLG